MPILVSSLSCNQCCGSKYIGFGSGSRFRSRFQGNTFQKKKLKIILENIFLLKKVPIFFKNYQNKISPKEIVILLSL